MGSLSSIVAASSTIFAQTAAALNRGVTVLRESSKNRVMGLGNDGKSNQTVPAVRVSKLVNSARTAVVHGRSAGHV